MLQTKKKKINFEVILVIILILISLFLNVFQYQNYKKELKRVNKAWEEAEKFIKSEKASNDSAYSKNLKDLHNQLLELDSLRIMDKKKFDLQISQLKSKYDKEYTRVSNTPIDGTLVISRQQLSQDIDYSKFRKK